MLPIKRINLAFSTMKHTLVLVRQGQNIWSKDKKWVGWLDVPLSPYGIKQVKQCAQSLKSKNIQFDLFYTSLLTRSIKSANLILDQLDMHYLPVYKDWRLNEKHYGALQGSSKIELTEKYGEKIVTEWRRSMTVRPPPLDINDPTHPINNPIYRNINPKLLPSSQNLTDVIQRITPFWQQQITKNLQRNKNILIVSHGSSIRALISLLNPQMTQNQIINFNIPNATPMIFILNEKLNITNVEYLGDEQEIHAKMLKIKFQTVKNQVA